MFVINPDPFLLPSYRISPFKTEYLALNSELPEDNFAEIYFNNRFGQRNWQYTYNGREAIRLALEKFQLDKNDLVTILTTSQNFYISSCVTSEIETFCRWNRTLVPETKIIFVNHEFGYPYPEMEKLIATGLPIIEDCCTTFFSQDESGNLGKYGDFSVYSFPKFFPIQIGGILVSNTQKLENSNSLLNEMQTQYIQNVVSNQLKSEAKLLAKRDENRKYVLSLFSKLGFSERFPNSEKIVPSVMLLKNNGTVKDLATLKTFLANNGIQSSVFYGEDAFFLPNHQNLTLSDMDYFYSCILEFLKIQ